MKYFALAMVAVLAMASVSMAAVTVDVVDNGILTSAGPDVLHSYTVILSGTKALGGNTPETTLTIDGAVYQVNAQNFGQDYPSIWSNEIDTASGMVPELVTYDTHFLIPSTGLTMVGDIAETCDDGNSTGIPGSGQSGFGTLTGTAFGFTQATVFDGTPLLQVVIEEGSTVTLKGMADDAGTPVSIETVIGVPEPGTIIMLVAGVLCLLGIRRK